MNSEPEVPQVYTLTALTRDAGQARRVVVSGFDLPLRQLLVTIFALALSFLPTAIAWAFIGSYALGITAAIVAGVFWLVEARARKGLRLRTYRALLDKRKESIGKFLSCGVEVDPLMGGYGVVHRSSMPNPFLPDPVRSHQVIFGSEPAAPPASSAGSGHGKPGRSATARSASARSTPATRKAARGKKVRTGRKIHSGDPFAAAALAASNDIDAR